MVIVIKHTILFKFSIRGLWKSTFVWINNRARMLLTVFENSISLGYTPYISGLSEPGVPFGKSVNPISTRRADCAHHITTCTAGFSELPTALYFKTSFKTEKWRHLAPRKILLSYTIILSDLQKATVCCDKKRSKLF